MFQIYKALILFLVLVTILRCAYELIVSSNIVRFINYEDRSHRNSYVYMRDLIVRNRVMIKLIFGNYTNVNPQDLNADFYIRSPIRVPYEYPYRKFGLPACIETPTELNSSINIKDIPYPLDTIRKKLTWLHNGGHWHPPDCTRTERIAIIIPYKRRFSNLQVLLLNLHPFLRNQQRDYTLFVAEQSGNSPFNKAIVMNAAFTEINKLDHFDCFIFHDVDLLPLNENNIYGCGLQPRHMSIFKDFHYRTLFGGVITITRNHFKLVNGYSNLFWGWGGEDDDMANRLILNQLHIGRRTVNVGRYRILNHAPWTRNKYRFAILVLVRHLYLREGLRNVGTKYNLVDVKQNFLYTLLLIDVKTNISNM